MNRQEQEEKLNTLAREVLLLSRNTLLVNLRFLDAALSQFEFVPWPDGTFSTNGKYLFYNPKYVLKCYSAEKERTVRDYLHMVLHCVFQHMYGAVNMERNLWNLACDIAVEYAINGLWLGAAAACRAKEEWETFVGLKQEIGKLTAEKIYRYYLDKHLSEDEIKALQLIFRGDHHDAWYRTSTELQQILTNAGISTEAAGRLGSGSLEDDSNDGNACDVQTHAMQAQIWKGIAERMQVDMETFGKQRGDTAGNLMQNLQAVNREKYDYTAFLKKFAVMGEDMRINDDEFDYIFYTYGLRLYRKMPLIEPLEYKDVKAIKEFVIAIDTSGSTSGELVQKFVQKTYNILKSTESFFTKINLHIIQCDADIQEDRKITSQEEFDEYLKTMQLRGLGGTDFRPVFEYVEKLRAEKEFRNLKGLIYFTDGFGAFPARKPDYDTAFVFIDDDYNNPDVPPWAIKLVLQKEEI